MVDNLSKKQRNYTMSRIRSSGTKQEIMVHTFLKERGIKHKMNPKINGHPDIILIDKKIAIFLHGCFWHGCSKHYIQPKTNVSYWSAKIKKNKERDNKNKAKLIKEGWKVVTIWEHELNNGIPDKLVKKTKVRSGRALSDARGRHHIEKLDEAMKLCNLVSL